MIINKPNWCNKITGCRYWFHSTQEKNDCEKCDQIK